MTVAFVRGMNCCGVGGVILASAETYIYVLEQNNITGAASVSASRSETNS